MLERRRLKCVLACVCVCVYVRVGYYYSMFMHRKQTTNFANSGTEMLIDSGEVSY